MCDPVTAVVGIASMGLMAHQVSQSRRSSSPPPRQDLPRPAPPPLPAPELQPKAPVLGVARPPKRKRNRHLHRLRIPQQDMDVGLNIPGA